MPDEKIRIDIVRGVEGDCLVIENFRCSGPKPWGEGRVTKTFKVDPKDLLRALRGTEFRLGIRIEGADG